MTEVSFLLNFEFVLIDFVPVTAKYHHWSFYVILKIIAVIPLRKIQTKIYEITVFNISKTRHDKKKSDFKFKISISKLAKNS